MNQVLYFKLLNSSRAKVLTIGFIFFVTCLFGSIAFLGPKSYIIYSLLTIIYLPFLGLGISIMFKTESKLVLANAFYGISLFLLSIGSYCIFIYRSFKICFLTDLIAIVILCLLLIALSLKIIKLKYLLYHYNDGKFNYGLSGYFIGNALSIFIYNIVKDKYGDAVLATYMNCMFLFIFLMLLYGAVFFVKKSYIIHKTPDAVIMYGDKLW